VLTIQLDDDSEQTLNKLAEQQEHLQPQQLIKKPINDYSMREIKKPHY
jgi:predicted transcriptional regulator